MIWYDMLGISIISKTPILCTENIAMQSEIEITALFYMNSNMTFKIADVILKHRNIRDNSLILYQKKTEVAWDKVSLTLHKSQ